MGTSWVVDSITCNVADRTPYRGDLVNGFCGAWVQPNPAGPQFDYIGIFRCIYYLNGPSGQGGTESRACIGDSVKAQSWMGQDWQLLTVMHGTLDGCLSSFLLPASAQPKPPPKQVPPAETPSFKGPTTVAVDDGAATIKLACGQESSPCSGSATLTKRAKLGSARYRIAAGKRARVRIRLTAAAKWQLAHRRLPVTLTLRATGAPVRRVALKLKRR